MIDTINTLYTSIGHPHRVTGKSAKYCGVSTAFKLGLSNDDIRLLGRWRSCETPQYYRQVDPMRLHNISRVMNLSIVSGNAPDMEPSSVSSLSLSTTLRPGKISAPLVRQFQLPLLTPAPPLLTPLSTPSTPCVPTLTLCPISGKFIPEGLASQTPMMKNRFLTLKSIQPAAPFFPPRRIPLSAVNLSYTNSPTEQQGCNIF